MGLIYSSSDLIANGLNSIGNNPIFKSDLTASMVSAFGMSLSGTILGSTDAIQKHVVSYIEKQGSLKYIKINPFCVEGSPFSTVAKVARTSATNATRFLLGADIANTWTADNDNTVVKRLEKSGIQLVGGGVSKATGIASGALAIDGMLSPQSKTKELRLAQALFIDSTISGGVTLAEDKLYELLNIK